MAEQTNDPQSQPEPAAAAVGVPFGTDPARPLAASRLADTSGRPPAAPIHNPSVVVSIRYPNGQTRRMKAKYIGWMGPANIESWEDTLLHAARAPIGAHVEEILHANRIGRPFPKQPAVFERRNAERKTMVAEFRRSGAGKGTPAEGSAVPLRDDLLELLQTEGPGVRHPGVRGWRPDPPSTGVLYDEPNPAQLARDEALANEPPRDQTREIEAAATRKRK